MAALVLTLLAIGPASAQTAEDRKDTSRIQHIDMGQQPRKDVGSGLTRRYAYGGATTIGIFDFKKGARVPAHTHANEQVTYIQTGRVRVLAEGKEFIVGPGETLIIPPYVEHSFEALEDTVDIDFFAPAREDWISGRDAYLGNAGARR